MNSFKIYFAIFSILLLSGCSKSGFETEAVVLNLPSLQPPAQTTSDAIITSFSVPESVLSLTVPISDFTIEKQSGVSYYYLLTEESQSPVASDSRWAATPPTQYSFDTSGTKTIFAWVKDNYGRIFQSQSATLTVSLPDTTPPVVGVFSIPQSSASLEIAVADFQASDDVSLSAYMITESSDLPSVDDSRWQTTAPSFYQIQNRPSIQQGEAGSGNGGSSKALFAWVKDSSENISTFKSATVLILSQIDEGPKTDSLPPYLYSFKVPITNGGLSVPLTSIYGFDDIGITGYLITESSSAPLVTSPGWSDAVPTQYVVSTSGYKTLYLWAKDATGKISTPISTNTYVYTDTTSDPLVLILVRDYLYTDAGFISVFNQYLSALNSRGYSNSIVQSVAKLTSNNLRQLIINTRAATQRKFAGVMLIGDINQPTYVHPNDFNGATAVFPSDLALTALDASIDYSVTDGKFSNIRNDIAPKLWIGRIDFSRNSLYGNELDTTKAYLTKLANDDSVKLTSSLVGKALLFVEKDWVNSYIVPSLPGFTKSTKTYPNLTQSSYLDEIKKPYEFLHVMVHSNPQRHYFAQFLLQASSKFTVETRLANLFACSAVLPSSTSLLEPYMLSGTRGGIAIIGSTKAGSMSDGQSAFYQNLNNSMSVGDALIAWQRDYIATDYLKMWHMGMTINGDPTAIPSF